MLFAASPFARTILDDRYAWTKPDGHKETWPEVASRVVDAVFSAVAHDDICFCNDCLGAADVGVAL
jgi:hypothetical protein